MPTSTAPPREWFSDPGLRGPSPIVIDNEGRIFGHLATWGTCHIGFGDKMCTTAPKNESGYREFMLGEVLCSDGSRVPVGNICMGTGHAKSSYRSAQASAHYDNTGTKVAVVAAGEDEYGIWVSGQVRPGMTEEDLWVLRSSTLSGDWRKKNGEWELVAALAVNTPGFPVPRTSLAASGEEQVTLVAAGIVRRDATEATALANGMFDMEKFARQIVSTMERQAERKEKMSAAQDVLTAAASRTAKNRMAAVAAQAKG